MTKAVSPVGGLVQRLLQQARRGAAGMDSYSSPVARRYKSPRPQGEGGEYDLPAHPSEKALEYFLLGRYRHDINAGSGK